MKNTDTNKVGLAPEDTAAKSPKLVEIVRKDLPRGSFISVRGQVTTMHDSYIGLYVGIGFSMLLVYLLMVVNFQSWTQPFIIITALPCALTGIIWMLFATGTTLSVPALMGAIMCMGVATANSVLVITFANELLERYKDPYRAALEAGYVRIRPVLMTALAMIIGMVPMALGLGEGGEQNAPLGRAVIGGFDLRYCGHIVLRSRRLHGGEQNESVTLGQTRLVACPPYPIM
jgi:multidrug efflux pump subunit AcrB